MLELLTEGGVTHLMSGRRRYSCRAFQLDSNRPGNSPTLTALVVERGPHLPVSRRQLGNAYRLTPRECQVTELLTLGLTNKEIAQRLGVTPNTVKMFLKLVMSKMDVTTRAGVIGKLFYPAA